MTKLKLTLTALALVCSVPSISNAAVSNSDVCEIAKGYGIIDAQMAKLPVEKHMDWMDLPVEKRAKEALLRHIEDDNPDITLEQVVEVIENRVLLKKAKNFLKANGDCKDFTG